MGVVVWHPVEIANLPNVGSNFGHGHDYFKHDMGLSENVGLIFPMK